MNDWMGFRTKKELESAIRLELKSKAQDQCGFWKWGEEFCSALLSDLFGARHYGCLHHGVAPSAFRVMFNEEYKTSYLMNALIPGFGWKAVSWRNAVDRKDIEDSIRDAMRKCAFDETISLRGGSCEECGAPGPCDVHHESPTFDVIYRMCVSVISESDRKWLLDHCFDDEFSSIGLKLHGHPAELLIRDIHKSSGCVLHVLCKPCHRKRHKT